MAGDQHAVHGHHQIRFDIVGTLADGQFIGFQGVLGQIAGSATMADDDGSVTGKRFIGVGFEGGGGQQAQSQGDGGRFAGIHEIFQGEV